MDEIKQNLKDLKVRFEQIKKQLDPEKLKQQARELEAQTMHEGFWSDQDNAKRISKQLSDKLQNISILENLEERINNALEFSNEESMREDLIPEIKQLSQAVSDLELKLFLSGPHDSSEAIISIHSGSGGVEAMDWAGMLYRMYQRFFERNNWEYELTNESLGEEAGFKSVSMIIHEPFAYGYLKGEAGTHRLVRLSPFNADNLRQTSFALVEVLPVIENDQEIVITPDEVEFEAFRSGGAGGQNVNKVNTAVRIRHIPTGIVVTAQTERSQLQNRENAMKLLTAKLWELKQQEQRQAEKGLKTTTQASWGTQIRSYVLHPYHMVKDLRTEVESSNTDAVLDGDLDQFIQTEIRTYSAPSEAKTSVVK